MDSSIENIGWKVSQDNHTSCCDCCRLLWAYSCLLCSGKMIFQAGDSIGTLQSINIFKTWICVYITLYHIILYHSILYYVYYIYILYIIYIFQSPRNSSFPAAFFWGTGPQLLRKKPHVSILIKPLALGILFLRHPSLFLVGHQACANVLCAMILGFVIQKELRLWHLKQKMSWTVPSRQLKSSRRPCTNSGRRAIASTEKTAILSMERKRSSLSTRRNSASTSNGAIAPEVPTALLLMALRNCRRGFRTKFPGFRGWEDWTTCKDQVRSEYL